MKYHLWRHNRPITIDIPEDGFSKLKSHDALDPNRVLGLDTESFLYRGKLTTMTVQVETYQRSILLETHNQFPLAALLQILMDQWGEKEEGPSQTKQRPRRPHKNGYYRDGRRQTITPLLLVFYNMEYDLGRLAFSTDENPFWRYLKRGSDTQRFMLTDTLELEMASCQPFGSAPHFEAFVREVSPTKIPGQPRRIIRLIGRDLWGYWKYGLDATAKALASYNVTQKIDLGDEKALFEKDWMDFTEEEKARIITYAQTDAKVTREIYLATVELLKSIDGVGEWMMNAQGVLPPSAPALAAKIMFQFASEDAWERPDPIAEQWSLDAYSGGRCFNLKQGNVQNINVFDITSAYPFAMSILPDPCTAEVEWFSTVKFSLTKFRGQFGVVEISADETNASYPSIRGRLNTGHIQYYYGHIDHQRTTIPEMMLGIVSGRLTNLTIHGGFIIHGSPEQSFLREYVHKFYTLKEASEKDSPVYLMAKLFINSPYGKLIEIIDARNVLLESAELMYIIPKFPKTVEPTITNAYIQGGLDNVDAVVADILDVIPSNGVTTLGEIMDGTDVKAGRYFLPTWAAQVTGFISAYMGCAALAAKALQGDTDSIFTDSTNWQTAFQGWMNQAGYPAPNHGLGAWTLEIENASGMLLGIKQYFLEAGNKIKAAHHAITDIPGHTRTERMAVLKGLFETMLATGECWYAPSKSPRKLKVALAQGKIPGEFIANGDPRLVNGILVPHRHIQLKDDHRMVKCGYNGSDFADHLLSYRPSQEFSFEKPTEIL